MIITCREISFVGVFAVLKVKQRNSRMFILPNRIRVPHKVIFCAMSNKKKKWLTDEEIQELIFLPDGKLSDADFDSDPNDPDYDPRDAENLSTRNSDQSS